ncbi:MAG: penicillin-binding protein 1C, partial [Bradyrhizobium icense]
SAGQATEPARQEWFLTGSQQAQFHVPAPQRTPEDAASARILRPVDGTILALDPDIPPQRQTLQLQASRDDVRWYLGERLLGQGRQLAWPPWPGRHVVRLQDPRGQVLDEVRLEVRGAGVRGAASSQPSSIQGTRQ